MASAFNAQSDPGVLMHERDARNAGANSRRQDQYRSADHTHLST